METIHEVIEPAEAQFSQSLEVMRVDVTTQRGRMLYQECLSVYQVPDERVTVPIVVLGERVLIGDEIEVEFGPAVDVGLNDGVDWPRIKGIP
jgi:hypothetical protein